MAANGAVKLVGRNGAPVRGCLTAAAEPGSMNTDRATGTTHHSTVDGRMLVNIVQACAIVGRRRRCIYYWMERGLVEYVLVPSGHRMIYADSLFRKPERG